MKSNNSPHAEVLKELLRSNPKVKAAEIVSAEGFPVASALPRGLDEAIVSAMTAALHSLSENAVNDMKKGKFEQLYVKATSGYIVIRRASPKSLLIVSASRDIRLGLLLLDCQRVCEEIEWIESQ